MTERIDHAAEARNLLEAADSDPEWAYRHHYTAKAQVHATLALAQEKRAANIIAYCAASDSLSRGHKEWIEEELGL